MSVKAKKHLGQHFLNDTNIAKKIVDSLTWEGYDKVLEVGPGMGILTQFLLEEGKEIHVVEIDTESVDYLNEKYNSIKPNLPIYSEDFLQMNLNELFDNIAILGNFPYNISTQIVFKILENKSYIPEMVGMFQKEVAERIVATHGNKTYGILSVLTQAYYHCEYLFTVNETAFTPPPKVKSGVIRIRRKQDKPNVDEKLFKTVVKTAFNQRRKKLSNALKPLNVTFNDKAKPYLDLRAEQLSVQDFLILTQNIIPCQ